MRLPVNRPRAATLAGLGLLALIAGCGQSGGYRPQASAGLSGPASGPAADYPMVLGAPFAVDGVTYTPADTLNYDQVGYAGVGSEGAGGVSLAHRTLPLPSYVEVTSLGTGRTILVRAERRGPMAGGNLIELSPGAAAQLGVDGAHLPVRVRRVNPPEPERALLRAGQRAAERMETPMSLVGVLMRKLEPNAAPAPVVVAAPAPQVAAPQVAPALPAKSVAAHPAPPATKPAIPAPAAHKGPVFVQVGAFSTAARAAEAARKVGGSVSLSGKFHRVRIGGFSTTADAGGALAKARAAGYSDARIQRAD